jgi:hypothetical protein
MTNGQRMLVGALGVVLVWLPIAIYAFVSKRHHRRMARMAEDARARVQTSENGGKSTL